MSEYQNDTITAICTGTGGALNILRISGPMALDVLQKIRIGSTSHNTNNARMMLFGHIENMHGETCLSVFMPGPHSYTGEDVAEIHCHGGTYAAKRVLQLALASGARMAQRGEFTKRAFLNGKLDLTQAEAVMDLISAGSEKAGYLAERQLNGVIGSNIRVIRTQIVSLLAESESRLDFSEENLDWMETDIFLQKIKELIQQTQNIADTATASSIIRDGIRLVIAGLPNAGKSSLMNQLLGYERAIVTDIPGTTRDTLEESFSIEGIRFAITDTAGLRSNTTDLVESFGIKRTRNTLATADIILWLLDASTPEKYKEQLQEMSLWNQSKTMIIPCWNKIDMISSLDCLQKMLPQSIAISAKTGDGILSLKKRIYDETCRGKLELLPDYAVSERHANLLKQAISALEFSVPNIQDEAWELVSSSLRNATEYLGSITGEIATPDVLDEIFERFCIGK